MAKRHIKKRGPAKVPNTRRQENFDHSVLPSTRGSKFSDNAVDGTFAEPLTSKYWKELNKVVDPELNIGIVDLGLIYRIKIKDKNAVVTMTLTSPTCPMANLIIEQIEAHMRTFTNLKNVQIEVVWDPPWDKSMINPEIREIMFGF
jgi:metal-sulfur cluster biosynthetic enzyme